MSAVRDVRVRARAHALHDAQRKFVPSFSPAFLPPAVCARATWLTPASSRAQWLLAHTERLAPHGRPGEDGGRDVAAVHAHRSGARRGGRAGGPVAPRARTARRAARGDREPDEAGAKVQPGDARAAAGRQNRRMTCPPPPRRRWYRLRRSSRRVCTKPPRSLCCVTPASLSISPN